MIPFNYIYLGYLSMILSEMLPPSKVERFLLIDKAWASHGTEPSPHHMNWDHVCHAHYKDTWPIPLIPSKQDLKSGRQRRNLQQHYLEGANVILLAVHLCGTLSLKAVDLFNHNSSVHFFGLKPCCLPGMIHAKRKEIFELTDPTQHFKYCFPAEAVCLHGKWNKNTWQGPHRTSMKAYFSAWADHLFRGMAANPMMDGSESDGSRPAAMAGGDDSGDDSGDNHGDSTNTAQHEPKKEPTTVPATTAAANDAPTTTTATTTIHMSAQKMQKTIMVQSGGGYQNEFLFAQRSPTTQDVWEKLAATHVPVPTMDEPETTRVVDDNDEQSPPPPPPPPPNAKRRRLEPGTSVVTTV